MNWLSHTIALFFTIACALLASAGLMLLFTSIWPAASPVSIILAAVLLALFLPLAGGIGSRHVMDRGQPLTAWLVAACVALLLGLTGLLAG